MEQGVDIEYTDSDGLTPLMYAAYNTIVWECETLIEGGAKSTL